MTGLAVAPSEKVVEKAGLIVAAHDADERPIVVDRCDPGVASFYALIPATIRPGRPAPLPYVVGYGRLLGWTCNCQARTRCSHVLAAAVLAERAGFNREDLP